MKKRLAMCAVAALVLILAGCAWIYTNESPVASFTATVDTPNRAPHIVTFDANLSSDPDGTIVFWEWWFGDDKVGGGVTVTHEYTDPGTYPVRLRVQDNDGAYDEITKDVTVAPDPTADFPIAVLYWLPAGKAQTGSEVTFVGRRSSGSIEWAWWDFGDGEKKNGPWTKMEQDAFGVWQQVPGMSVVTHIYAIPSKYVVSLMIIDNNGKAASTSRTIRVNYPPAPPP